MRKRRRGPRSLKAHQRRFVNSTVSRESHRDLQINESVNTLTPADLYDALANKFETVITSVLTIFEKGEILIDGRGEGSLQREK